MSLASTSFTAPASAFTAPRAAAVSMVATSNEVAKSEFCYGLPGAIAPVGEFDPANLLADQSKDEVYRWREAELTHGRVGMLASAGFLVQENFHPLFSGDNGPAIEQIPQLPPALWFGMTLGIGIAESLRIQKGWANPYEKMDNVQSLKDGYYPGDLGFDPLGLKPEDPAELRIMQEKELSHGRLAMLAAAGFMAQEAVTGATWGELDFEFEKVLIGGWTAKEAALTGM